MNLPITGREEDVADQFATYVFLKSTSQSNVALLQGGIWFFTETDLSYTREHLAGEHSLNLQRQFNIICWAYGKEPRLFAPLVRALALPGDRARGCEREYTQMARAIELLFMPVLTLK